METTGLNPHIESNPLFELQRTLYSSGNYTRRRLHRERLGWVTRAIDRYASANARAIEYGPGSGIYLPHLNSRFAEVTAADIEPAYLAGIQPLLASNPRLKLRVDDLEASAFADGAFDFVLCSEVLEHVPHPETAMRELARILRPGGVAVVTTPQSRSAMELCCKVAFLPGVIQMVRWVYREPILPTGHISLRSRSQFKEIIGAAGLGVIEETVFGLYVPVVAELGGDAGGLWIEKIEPSLVNSPFSGLLWTQAYVLRKATGT